MKKSTLYAPRLKGDIDLGLEPSRLDGKGDRAWARMDFPGRLIPGQTDQDLYTKSPSTAQKFEIGTKREEYGRTFRYAKAGRAITTFGLWLRLLANANFRDCTGHVDEFAFTGKPYLQVEDGVSEIQLNIATAYPRNYFQGGYVTSFVAPYQTHYIVASDLGNGTYCSIYLDHPITTVIPVTSDVEVYRSPYSNVIDMNPPAGYGSFVSFVGLQYCPALDLGDFFWLQTKGPCWICPTHFDNNNCPGRAVNSRTIWASSDGAIRSATGHDPSTGFQYIGYLLSATIGGTGSVYIMLQLE